MIMLSAVDVLAVNNFGDTRSGGLAGPMGLFIIVLLAIATVLLIRNMNSRLRRLPDKFPDPDADRRAAEVARLEADLARADGADDLTRADAVDEPEVAPGAPTDRPAGPNDRN
jgi:hypothetical protein